MKKLNCRFPLFKNRINPRFSMNFIYFQKFYLSIFIQKGKNCIFAVKFRFY